MKFEVVGFYPVTELSYNPKCKDFLGTIHLYVADFGLDIRGIRVVKSGKALFFQMPHVIGLDSETGEKVRYPVVRWTDQSHQKEMIDFLHKNAKSEALVMAKQLKGIQDAYNRSPRSKNKSPIHTAPWMRKNTTQASKMGKFRSF